MAPRLDLVLTSVEALNGTAGPAFPYVIIHRDARGTSAPATMIKLSLLTMITQEEFRRALGCFASGVTVISVEFEGRVHGMTANAFCSVSLDPPLVLVCVDQKARTHAHLHARKRFGVNILAKDQRAISEYYALPIPDHTEAEKVGAHFERTTHGTPVLLDALAYLECRLHAAQDAGDHTIFIAEVEEVVVRNDNPLLYFQGRYTDVV